MKKNLTNIANPLKKKIKNKKNLNNRKTQNRTFSLQVIKKQRIAQDIN